MKEIQRITRKYYGQLYANKLDNVDEIDKFVETYSLPKLNQEESENLNTQTTSELEEVIKNLPTNKGPETNGFPGEFHQTFKEITLVFLKLFQKMQEEGKLSS